jgi:branched-chain amino acid aminotransferase
MPSFVNFNGQLYPAETSLLSVANRAYRYGDGLFESMKLANGEVKFAELHAARLQKGMQTLKLDNHEKFNTQFLNKIAAELAQWNKAKHGRLRLTVYRDSGGLYTPSGNKPGWSLELQPEDSPAYHVNSKGLIMDAYTELLKPVNYLSNLKTCNSLIYVMGGLYKLEHKLEDVFILNQSNFLCEGLSSNVFVWYDNHLYTPALSEGCVSGVMREVVMKLAVDLNIPLTEAQINPDILHEADEVFLTNATRGIQWVMGYGIKRYFNRLSKQLVGELNKR